MENGLATLYYNDGTGQMVVGGHEVGLLGGTTPFWTGGSTLVAMGTYTDTPGVSSYLWNSAVSGSGSQDGVTADFRGYTAGIWKDGTLRGKLAGLYTTSDGRAGFLTDYWGPTQNEYGAYHGGIGMWRADIGVYAQEIPELTGKANLAIGDLQTGQFEISAHGQFDDGQEGRTGGILGAGWADRLYLTGNSEALPYGVLNFRFLGPIPFPGGRIWKQPPGPLLWEARQVRNLLEGISSPWPAASGPATGGSTVG
jgi:hypothetical protein